jgi:large subunit ribosomal protein L21
LLNFPATTNTYPHKKRLSQVFAVVEIAGKQYRVAQNDTLSVPALKEKIGSHIRFEKVLLMGSEQGVKVGNPVVPGATVEAAVLGHLKGDKVTVFRKKRRKGYRVKRGHRQGHTQIQITKIGA